MSILDGVRKAVFAYYEATGRPLKELALEPNEYRQLCSEASDMITRELPFGLLPTMVEIDGCEVWSR